MAHRSRWTIKHSLQFKCFGASLSVFYWKDNYRSDRRPETKQVIEGKIDRFRSGRVRVSDRVRVRFRSLIWTRSPIWTYQFWRLLTDCQSEPNTVLTENWSFFSDDILLLGLVTWHESRHLALRLWNTSDKNAMLMSSTCTCISQKCNKHAQVHRTWLNE